ncbi:MAG: PfkB family carbohydrate kinase [Acidobacteriaceae bacterium]
MRFKDDVRYQYTMNNMGKPRRIASIGEILWDLLPDGPQLGGTTANFAAFLAQLSSDVAGESADEVFLVSRTGDDELGLQARKQLAVCSVREEHVSLDPSRPTGTVAVILDANKGPSYQIHKNVAWDAIPETPQLAALAPTLDAVCFGTLAQRSSVSRATIRSVIEASRTDCLRVFDVNLREPDWTTEAVVWGCNHASILKMNLEEVPHVAQAVGASGEEREPLPAAHFLLRQFPIQMVAITRGGEGSLMVTREDICEHPGVSVQVEDTIGAGDCFTAALTYYAMRHCSLPVLAEAANRWGAWVATQRGGMPLLDGNTRRTVDATIQKASGIQF